MAQLGALDQIQKVIYERAIVPMVLYGAEIWGARSQDSRIVRKLAAIQRSFLLTIHKTYKTTPNTAIQVLSGCPPLHLSVKMRFDYHELKNNTINLDLPTNVGEQNHPKIVVPIPLINWENHNKSSNFECYTDGSKMNSKVGASVVIYKKEVELKTWNARLPDDCTVFQAELKALRQCVVMLSTLLNRGDCISIFSDSSTALDVVSGCNESYIDAVWTWHKMVELMKNGHHFQLGWIKAHVGHKGNERADSLAKEATLQEDILRHKIPISSLKRTAINTLHRNWQELWTTGNSGRSTYQGINNIQNKWRLLSGHVVHLLTGHGPFNAYLKRFNLCETDGLCPCGGIDDPDHIIYHCGLPRRHLARSRLFDRCLIRGLDCEPLSQLLRPETLPLFMQFAKEVVYDYEIEQE